MQELINDFILAGIYCELVWLKIRTVSLFSLPYWTLMRYVRLYGILPKVYLQPYISKAIFWTNTFHNSNCSPTFYANHSYHISTKSWVCGAHRKPTMAWCKPDLLPYVVENWNCPMLMEVFP